MTARETLVKVGHFAVGGEDDVLVTVGLGSCVVILLHDPVARVGAMAHVLLPAPVHTRHGRTPSKFATTAIPLLIEEITGAGGAMRRLQARLAGGASMFTALMTAGSIPMGERNVAAARDALRSAGVPVIAEDVGGEHGRSVRFAAGAGEATVSSVYREDVIL